MEEAGWRNAPQPDEQPGQDIDQMRKAIDNLDQTIASLLQQRLMLACEIGALKANSQTPVKDRRRELEVLSKVCSVTDDQRIAGALTAIYETVMSEACVLQRTINEDADKRGTSPNEAIMYFPRVLVVGTGLIGGALAAQIKRHLPQTIVSGVDTPAVLEEARSAGIIDIAEADLSRAVSRAGLILLCASPDTNMRLLAEIAPLTRRRQVIVDVTSTKEQICRLAEELPMKADFVGGHPLFGSQNSGVAAALELPVSGEKFCLTRTSRSSELTMRRLARWLGELKLNVIHSEPHAHDATLARTSHLVQLLAVALGSAIAGGRSDAELQTMLGLSGTALKQWSRLMSSSPQLWLQIIHQNQPNIEAALDELICQLNQTRHAITTGDDQAIQAVFTQASRIPSTIERATE